MKIWIFKTAFFIAVAVCITLTAAAALLVVIFTAYGILSVIAGFGVRLGVITAVASYLAPGALITAGLSCLSLAGVFTCLIFMNIPRLTQQYAVTRDKIFLSNNYL